MCLAELVEKQFGQNTWQQVLEAAGVPVTRKFLMIETTSDSDFENLLLATGQVLEWSEEQTSQAFGEHWCTVFAPRLYAQYFKRVTNARDFLLHMNGVHGRVTQGVSNVNAPAFDYEDGGPGRLVMEYRSDRHLEELWIGLIKGVGKAYNERLVINRLAKNKVEVIFAGAA
jgi:hypothetical protein